MLSLIEQAERLFVYHATRRSFVMKRGDKICLFCWIVLFITSSPIVFAQDKIQSPVPANNPQIHPDHERKTMVATIESTVSGTRFAMLPRQKGGAAPLLLLFSGVGVETLSVEPYCHVGQLLHEQGWNVVSLDLPCHGSERLAGEPAELSGWAARILAGRDIVEPFQKRVNDVVDDCIAKGAADPARIAAAGTSRGGLMAIQITAGDPRISAVAAFAPVTDLIALSEFRGQEKNPLVQKLALLNAVEKLRNRPVWFMIGNADERVGTDKAEAFARALTQFAVARNESPQVVFQVVPVPGHVSLVDWHIQAATWLQKTVEKLPPEKIR